MKWSVKGYVLVSGGMVSTFHLKKFAISRMVSWGSCFRCSWIFFASCSAYLFLRYLSLMAATIMVATGKEAISISGFFGGCGGVASKDAVMCCWACFMIWGVSVSSCIVRFSCLM